MEINFLYGKDGLKFNIDENKYNITLFEPDEEKGIPDPGAAVRESILKPLNSQPLDKLLKKKMSAIEENNIIIVIEDHTRPLPSRIVLEPLIDVINSVGITDDKIKILVATGLHRQSTYDELQRMVGDRIIDRFDIIFHNANNQMELEEVGTTKFGNSVYLNGRYVNAGFKILTGYVEPHFFAGFSGGRKSLVPGIAGKDTILFNHSAKSCDSEFARFGQLEGNPIHEDAQEVARFPKAKPDFCINATINSDHEITRVSSGNIIAVHNYLVKSQQSACFQQIDRKFDIVLCGNGGYPLDQNLYQGVKSMAIGEMAAKDKGIIISINECSDKVGQEEFEKLINSGKEPERLYKEAMEGIIKIPDIWEIQILARIMMKHTIYVVSSMDEKELGNIGLKYASTVAEALDFATNDLIKSGLISEADKPNVLILPKGPLVLPDLRC